MAIRLTDDRRERLLSSIRGFHVEEFDEDISTFRAGKLLEFFLEALGPHVYNQAVQDARSFVQRRLDEMDGEVWAPGGS